MVSYSGRVFALCCDIYNMQVHHSVRISDQEGVYALDSCLCTGSGSVALCLSLSNQTIQCYDACTASALCTIRGHTCTIRDVTSSPTQPHVLYSAQEDTGVMVSDIRQQSPAHFLSEYCGTGATGGAVATSPNGDDIAVAVNGDIHIVDTRTWNTKRIIGTMHLDEITRVRFISESVYCSAGEDQMINFIDSSPVVKENDMLLQALSCGEVATKMNAFPEHATLGIVGSCENAYTFPYVLQQQEVRYERPDDATYCVDICSLRGRLYLVTGVRDEDGNAGPLSVMDVATRERVALPQFHKEISRVAIGVEDCLITGGEDNVLAFWREGPVSGGGNVELTGAASSCTSVGHPPHKLKPLPRGSRTQKFVPYIKGAS